MKKKEERDELTKQELERVVGGLRGIGVEWNRKTGEANPVGRPIPRVRRVKPFAGEPLDGGTVEVDYNFKG